MHRFICTKKVQTTRLGSSTLCCYNYSILNQLKSTCTCTCESVPLVMRFSYVTPSRLYSAAEAMVYATPIATLLSLSVVMRWDPAPRLLIITPTITTATCQVFGKSFRQIRSWGEGGSSVQCNVKKHLLKAQVWPDRWHLEKRWFSLSAYTRAHRQALEAAHRFIQQKHSGCGSKYLTCRCKYNPVLFSVVEGCQELSFRVYIKQFLKHHIHGQRWANVGET